MWKPGEIAAIVSSKQKEVEKLKRLRNVEMLTEERFFHRTTNHLKITDKSFTIIPELIRMQHGKIINKGTSTEAVTRAYAAYFSSSISICTDKKNYGGSTDDLISARDSHVCIIRNDFIIDEYQVVESKAFGADAIILKPELINSNGSNILAIAAKQLGMDILFEVPSVKLLDQIRELPAVIIISLKTAASAKKLFIELKKEINGEIPVIASFEFNKVEEVRMIMDAGFNGLKTGAWFMKQNSPVNAVKEFSYSL